MAKDKQTESSKLEQKNAAMDKAQEEGRKRFEKQEVEDNQTPRKAVGEAVDYVKEKASKFGKDFVEGAKLYGETYKKGLGMKNGGSASSRADGIATKGKTKGKIY